MEGHILLKKIVTYDKKEISDPENSTYDEKDGFWLWGPYNEVLVKSNNSNCPKRGTKKKDIETGEDLKGE